MSNAVDGPHDVEEERPACHRDEERIRPALIPVDAGYAYGNQK